MAACDDSIVKQDSGRVGLKYAWEECAKVLPDNPVWKPCEPNSFTDFGSEITTVARSPISAGRQRKKGVPVDMDASGGFQQDVTTGGVTEDLLQGFFFANARQKSTTAPLNGEAIPIGLVDTDGLHADDAGVGIIVPPFPAFAAGDIVLLEGFGLVANNGVKTVSGTSTDILIPITGLTDEVPPTGATCRVIGKTIAGANIEMNGGLVRLVSSGMDQLGVIAGEWIFLGGDAANSAFTVAKGFARVSEITAGYLEFDKVSWNDGVNEDGSSVVLQVFFGDIIRNEPNPDDIIDRTIQLERTVGRDEDGVQSEYLLGCTANELTLNLATGSILTMDLGYIALDNEQRTGAMGTKPGLRVTIPSGEAFNCTNDMYRVKLALVDETNAAPKPLYAYAEEATLTINNNVTGEKAIGVNGSFSTNVGIFEVGGSITAYFTTVESVQAVSNNSDITMDMIFAKDNKGILWDIPLMTLGNGRLDVQLGQSIRLPLDQTAAENKFGTTLVYQYFPYLPNLAMPL